MTSGTRPGSCRQLGSALLLALLLTPPAGAAAAEESCSARPYVVKIHADWCGTCKALEATWAQVEQELGDRASVVTFDVSDRKAYEESRALAERLGIGDFFREHRSRTGAVAILDCKTLEPVEVLVGERDLGKYREAVSRADHSS